MEIDGMDLGLTAREFIYEVPPPFGPNRGPAKFSVTQKPVGPGDMDARSALSELQHMSRVRDKEIENRYEETKDYDAYLRDKSEAVEWVHRASLEYYFQYCVVDWSTTIQSRGVAIDPTPENFVELFMVKDANIQELNERMKADVVGLQKFIHDAQKEADEARIKN